MFAALYIPEFHMAALQSCQKEELRPCAILSEASGRTSKEALPLLAVNTPARHAGLAGGWTLNRALIRCPDLVTLDRDLVAEATLSTQLVELGESITPDLEVASEDSVILDLAGIRSSPALLRAALGEIEVWQAFAATPDLARLAVRDLSTQGRTLTAPDLACLPLSLLNLLARNQAPLALLDGWGLHTLGDFAALPRQAITERLGPEAGRWHDILNGSWCRLLRLHRPPESLRQRVDFEDALGGLEPLIFSVKRLLHTLSGRLASRHLAAGRLDVRLVLETGEFEERKVRLAEPQTAVEPMLSPLQTWLESLHLTAPVVAVELEPETTFATSAQRDWYGRQLAQPARWAETLAKLEALLGPGRVGVPVPPESHDSGRFGLQAIGEPAAARQNHEHPACPVPLYRYRPPRQIAVAFEVTGKRPLPLALLNGPYPGEIIARQGPFAASGDWWEPTDSWQRLEWDIQLASHHLLRLIYLPPEQWQLEGIYQ